MCYRMVQTNKHTQNLTNILKSLKNSNLVQLMYKRHISPSWGCAHYTDLVCVDNLRRDILVQLCCARQPSSFSSSNDFDIKMTRKRRSMRWLISLSTIICFTPLPFCSGPSVMGQQTTEPLTPQHYSRARLLFMHRQPNGDTNDNVTHQIFLPAASVNIMVAITSENTPLFQK